jgi:hypothetical protein
VTRPFGFRGRWWVAATPAAVQAVLVDLEHYPEWWPQVRAVAKIDDDRARVLCRSTLPYTLDLELAAVHRQPHLLQTRLRGDLTGWVRWRIRGEGEGTRLELSQRVVVTHRLLGVAAALAPAPLRWNHDRMMAGCLAGLRARLGEVS